MRIQSFSEHLFILNHTGNRRASATFGLFRPDFITGLLSMLMPLAIDMYLPSMPTIARDFGVI